MLLLAIDPGPHIGVAVDINGDMSTMTILDPYELWSIIRMHKPDALAFETFFTGNRVDANMLHTIELVGSLRGICHVLDIPAYGQMPQARKSFLQEAKAYLGEGHSNIPHEVDALAHLLLLKWRITNGKLDSTQRAKGAGSRLQERESVPT